MEFSNRRNIQDHGAYFVFANDSVFLYEGDHVEAKPFDYQAPKLGQNPMQLPHINNETIKR